MIGKTVRVIVDRPLGSLHPKHGKIYYSVNYGYTETVSDSDGEKQYAYILGVDRPLKEFTGRVAAVVHRYDDVKEKLIVVPEGMTFSPEEIREQIKFQEKYFKSEIRM